MLHSERVPTARAEEMWAGVAERIAGELSRCENLDQHKLAKVSSLIHAFRVPGCSTRLADVTAALDKRGVQLDSGWVDAAGRPDIRRSGVVRLFPRTPSAPGSSLVSEDGIHTSVWRKGNPGEECSLPLPSGARADGDILWFDVDAPSSPDDVEARAISVTSQLSPWCPGLDVEMMRDLLREDSQPKVETYGDDHGSVRGVSVVAAIAREVRGKDDDRDGVGEQVVFQLVELLVGDGWIASCWHPSRICGGVDGDRLDTPLLKEPFLSDVRRRWVRGTQSDSVNRAVKTSGDLGICLVRSLLHTYDATHRMMERWMADWEVEFYTSLKCSDRADRLKEAASEISDFLYMTAEIRRKLTAFQHARLSAPDRTWFPRVSDHTDPREEGLTDGQVNALVSALDSAKQNFDRLSGDIRANMDVLMLQSTATQQESTERVQNYLGKVTGLVLVPTLIAGLFGANTQLPGLGSWMGFELMLFLMMVSAVAVYFVIRRIARP